MKPYNVNDVADYVIMSLDEDKNVSLINLKLQKLVYYIQAWCLGIQGEKFVDASFEAWVHGPVCRQLFNRFKDTKSLYSIISIDDVINKDARASFNDEDAEFIDYILENYARFSGTQLEEMTHKDSPWIDARGNRSPMEKCEEIITVESMRSYYGEKYKKISC